MSLEQFLLKLSETTPHEKLTKDFIAKEIDRWRNPEKYAPKEVKVKKLSFDVIIDEFLKQKQKGKHINLRTAHRYTHERDYGDDLHELYLGKLYSDKAFHILWKWLDHNMEKWWV